MNDNENLRSSLFVSVDDAKTKTRTVWQRSGLVLAAAVVFVGSSLCYTLSVDDAKAKHELIGARPCCCGCVCRVLLEWRI